MLKIELLNQIITLLASGESFPDKCRDHALSGDWTGYQECHILSDCLLIYYIEKDVLVLILANTGTHSDLYIYQIVCHRTGNNCTVLSKRNIIIMNNSLYIVLRFQS